VTGAEPADAELPAVLELLVVGCEPVVPVDVDAVLEPVLLVVGAADAASR
jgi:hypothetical protein